MAPAVSTGPPSTTNAVTVTGTRLRHTTRQILPDVTQSSGMNRSADLRNEASQPQHQLTKSNVALKAARESAADSAAAADAKDAKKTAASEVVPVVPVAAIEGPEPTVNSPSDPSSSTPNAAQAALTPNLHSPPIPLPPNMPPLPPTVNATPLTTLPVLQTLSEERSSTPAQSERTGSFAAAGYVHLGPVQTSEEALNDRGSRSSGSKLRGPGSGGSKGKRRVSGSATSASAFGSGSMNGGRSVAGSAPKSNHKVFSATGSRSASSHGSVPPSPFPLHLPASRRRPLSGSVEVPSPNGGDATGSGGDHVLNGSPYNSYESSASASVSGAEVDSLLSQSIPEVEELEQLEREMFNRSVENLAVPGEVTALGSGGNDSAVVDDDDDDEEGTRELSPDMDADEDDRERESMGDASGHSGSSNSLFGYPKTTRFQHVETENGASG